MSKRDYYGILGVARDASEKEIKKAYRRVAMKWHPDRSDGNKEHEEKFKEAAGAYEVLSDSQKRAAYDQFGHDGVDQAAGGGGGGFHSSHSFSDISDIFGDIFSGGFSGGFSNQEQGPQRGSDLQYTLKIDLEAAVKGTTTKIRIPTLAQCKHCHGTGAKKGSKPTSCSTCGGVGQVRMQQGPFSIQQACPHCHGKGSMIKDHCPRCRGDGRIEETKTLSVKIPAGIDSGDRIRLAGEGQAGEEGGPSGDLYVQIAVNKHTLFERDGKNLYCEMPISMIDATLGGELDIPTLGGRVKLKVPAETQTGKLFRLRGKGVKPVRGGSVGDLLCRVQVETPVHLSKEQKELLKQLHVSFDKSKAGHHSPRKKNWFDNVKRFFDGIKGA